MWCTRACGGHQQDTTAFVEIIPLLSCDKPSRVHRCLVGTLGLNTSALALHATALIGRNGWGDGMELATTGPLHSLVSYMDPQHSG